MNRSIFLRSLFMVTIANFAAQIPYYIHQYYLPSHASSGQAVILLMSAVLIWFLAGFYGLVKHKKPGYMLLISFLLVEFLFYLQTQIVQVVTVHEMFLYVLHPHGWGLFLVFGIGYINFFASAWFLLYLLARKKEFLESNA